MESNQLGERIKKLRQKLGLSQDDFARKADVATQRLQRLRPKLSKNILYLL